MTLAEQLQKLIDMKVAGHLSEDEFERAKARIIDRGNVIDGSPPLERSSSLSEFPAFACQSSRWSSGNLFFPDRISLTPEGVDFTKGALFGSSQEHINFKSIASVKVKNGIFLSDLSIETSGGSQPIYINGLWKSDASRVQAAIRAVQTSLA